MTFKLFKKAENIKELGVLPKAMTIMANVYKGMYSMAWGFSALGTYLNWKNNTGFFTLISIGTVPLIINLAFWNRLIRVQV